jgi:ribosomal protein S18 acetylase RimI-like enzyme
VSEPAIAIRLLSPEDAALFRDIRLEGLRRDPDAFTSTFEEESGKELAFFAERLAASAVFAAFRGAELLGVAGFYVQRGPKHGHKGMLWGMYVRPQARGSGIAGRLVEAVVEHARLHVELIQLTVVSDNMAARRLYERFGFVEYGLEKRAAKYRGRYHDDLLIAKMLAAPDGAPGTDPPSGERGQRREDSGERKA